MMYSAQQLSVAEALLGQLKIVLFRCQGKQYALQLVANMAAMRLA